MDLLLDALPAITASGAQLALIGSGDKALEHRFAAAAARHPRRVATIVGYDESVAHLVQGGADALIVPSRFEPCGLTQLCGLRYGCVPVVARTGGLADTVIDANVAALSARVATGFQFAPVEAAPLAAAIRRAVALHRQPQDWAAIQRQGMKADVSWDRSAAQYAALFASLVPAAAGADA
jgi:starch synthase